MQILLQPSSNGCKSLRTWEPSTPGDCQAFLAGQQQPDQGYPFWRSKAEFVILIPLKSQGLQAQEIESRDVARSSRVLKYPLVACQVQEVFLFPSRSDWVYLATLGTSEMAPGRADWGLGFSWEVWEACGKRYSVTCSGNSWSLALRSESNVPPGQTGAGPWVLFYLSLQHQIWPLVRAPLGHFGQVPAAQVYRGGPYACHLGGGKFQDSQSRSEDELQGLLLVSCGTKHNTLSGLLWTLVIISHLITLTFTDDFKWAHKKQTLQSFWSGIFQAHRAAKQRQLLFSVGCPPILIHVSITSNNLPLH